MAKRNKDLGAVLARVVEAFVLTGTSEEVAAFRSEVTAALGTRCAGLREAASIPALLTKIFTSTETVNAYADPGEERIAFRNADRAPIKRLVQIIVRETGMNADDAREALLVACDARPWQYAVDGRSVQVRYVDGERISPTSDLRALRTMWGKSDRNDGWKVIAPRADEARMKRIRERKEIPSEYMPSRDDLPALPAMASNDAAPSSAPISGETTTVDGMTDAPASGERTADDADSDPIAANG